MSNLSKKEKKSVSETEPSWRNPELRQKDNAVVTPFAYKNNKYEKKESILLK